MIFSNEGRKNVKREEIVHLDKNLKKKVNFHSNKNSNYTTRQATSTITETPVIKTHRYKDESRRNKKKKAKRMKKVGRLPAAQACGLTETWPAEEEEHN